MKKRFIPLLLLLAILLASCKAVYDNGENTASSTPADSPTAATSTVSTGSVETGRIEISLSYDELYMLYWSDGDDWLLSLQDDGSFTQWHTQYYDMACSFAEQTGIAGSAGFIPVEDFFDVIDVLILDNNENPNIFLAFCEANSVDGEKAAAYLSEAMVYGYINTANPENTSFSAEDINKLYISDSFDWGYSEQTENFEWRYEFIECALRFLKETGQYATDDEERITQEIFTALNEFNFNLEGISNLFEALCTVLMIDSELCYNLLEAQYNALPKN